MPTTNWRVLRREIMRPLGSVEFATTTGIGGGALGGASIISTDLGARFNNDDHFNGWFATVVLDVDGGPPANGLGTATRRVTDYTGSSGTLVLSSPALLSEDEAVDVDLYKFHPDDILQAFNRARQDVFPQIGIVRDVESVVTGPNQYLYTVPSTVRRIVRVEFGQRIQAASVTENQVTDPGFEDWANAASLTSWSESGSGATVAKEAQTSSPLNYAVLEGTYSALLHAGGGGEATLSQTITPATATENIEVNFSVWVYATNATNLIKASINSTDGTAHGGTGWERLTVSANTAVAAGNVTVRVRILTDTALDCYVDEAVAIMGPSEPHDRPWAPILGYDWIPPVNGASNGGLIRLQDPLPSGHRIRFVGVDQLSAISVDTDTVEVDINLLDPLYNLTRAYLCEGQVKQATSLNYIRLWGDRQSEYMGRYLDGIDGGHRLSMPNKRIRIPDKVI
jgi:hypothetical protein